MTHTYRKKLLLGCAISNGCLASALAFGLVPLGEEHQMHMQTLIAKAEGKLVVPTGTLQ